MAPQQKVAFIGSGNMATALIRGLLRAGASRPEDLIAADPHPEQLERLAGEFGVATVTDNREAAARADIVVLSIKPQVMAAVLDAIAPSVDDSKLVISIAAGVPIARIAERLGSLTRIVRAMPNSPALIGAGATAVAAGLNASAADLALARALFDSVGITVTVNEEMLDAVTGLSGSGPAYVFLIIEALADAGVKMGLSRQSALKLTVQTILGSARMLQETGLHPAQLKDQVTSPGGTTSVGLHTLEAGGLRTTLIDAVERATARSRELGRSQIRSQP